MARTLKTIFDVLARDGATPTLNRVTGSFGSMRRAARNANQALGGMNASIAQMQRRAQSAMAGGFIGAGFMKIGGGLTKFVAEAVRESGELEYELATLRGISGAAADEMDRLASAAARAGVETQFTPTQAVQGLQSLAQQGFTTAQQLEGLMPSLLLAGASGGKVPLADAAKLTAQVIKGFGRDAEDAGLMVDQMVMTTTKSGMAIDDLAGAMQYASSAAQNMEVDFTDTLATLGLIKNVIPSAEVAGSAFQILTARLSKPLNQKKLKKNLGIDVIDKATGEFRGFGALLLDISGKFAKMKGGKRAGLIQEIFGPRGMKGIMPLMTQLEKGVTTQTGAVLKGQAAWKYWMDTLDPDKVDGFASAMNDMKLDTLKGQTELLTGSFLTFMIEIGKGTAQFRKGFIKAFLGGFNTFLSVFQELPEALKAGFAGFLEIGGGVLKFIGVLLIAKAALGLFGFSLSSVILGIGKMLLLAVPLTIFFSGIALGAYGIYRAVSTNFGRAEKSSTSLVDKIKLGYKGIVDIVKQGGLSKATEKELAKMKDSAGMSAFFKGFIKVWRNAKAFFKGVIAGFDNGLKRLEKPWGKFVATVTRIFSIWTGGGKNAINTTDKWTRKGEAFGDVLVGLSEVTLELMTKFVEFGEKVSKSMEGVTVDEVIDGFATLLNTIAATGKAVMAVGRLFNVVGTIIGEYFGGLVVYWTAVLDKIKAEFSKDILWFQQKINSVSLKFGQGPVFDIDPNEIKKIEQQIASADARIKLGFNFVGESSLLDPSRQQIGRQEAAYGHAYRSFGKTESLIQQRNAIIKAMRRDTPMALGGLKGEFRSVVADRDKAKAMTATSDIASIVKKLGARQSEIVERQQSSSFDESTKLERKMLSTELAAIKEILKMRQNIRVSADVDGKRLFELYNEKAAEDKEDDFSNPNMTPVTQGG
ncbi:MAG: phage tail tape measure protein [FCB group bacterium]|nr:phage tail tape measure protein [FCB group bacterium]